MPMLNSTDSAEAGYIREHRPVNGLYDNHLSIMGVKVLGDGALGSRGSALLEDYSDDPGNRGSYRFTDEEIYNVMSLPTTTAIRSRTTPSATVPTTRC